MAEFIRTPKGANITVYTKAETAGKPPGTFEESPPAVMAAMGWSEPRYVWRSPLLSAGAKGQAASVWANHFGVMAAGEAKPGFFEIFTDSRGPLTGFEVRESERIAGVAIDDHTAVAAYNRQLDQDAALYGEDYSLAELSAMLAPADAERLRKVHAWVASMLELEPLYFSFDVDVVLSETSWMVEGVRHVEITATGKAPSIGVAFPGPHSRVRDVFNLTQYLGGGPNPAALGRRATQLPGRDRAYRIVGKEAFSTYLWSPVLVLSQLQVRQLQEGRAVTMPRSPIVPPELWSW